MVSEVESLGELEAAVLAALSRGDEPLTVREVQLRVKRAKLAYTTILTVLDRLFAKGLVARQKEGRAFLYRAVVSPEQWRGQRAAAVLAGRDEPPSRAVLLAFLDSAENASPEVLSELAELLAERACRPKKSSKKAKE